MATAIANTGPAALVDPTTGYPRPPLVTTVVSGATLIAFTGKQAASNGSYAYGIGLFVREDDYQPYVVWTTILLPDGRFIAESGSYTSTLQAAVDIFKDRGGRVT